MLASVRSLVSPRSPTCGVACRSDPCTLRRIRYAERELEAEPAPVLWAELGVVAHLIGEPMPVLTSGMLSALARFDPRHRECTLSHAVEGAVRSRIPMFVRHLSPAGLAVHVNDAMNAAVTGDGSGGHICEWRRWRIDVGTDAAARRRVLHGMDRPSRLESALDCRADDPVWPGRLADLLQDFVALPWPAAYTSAVADHGAGSQVARELRAGRAGGGSGRSGQRLGRGSVVEVRYGAGSGLR